jgi:oxygen-independent coproporphyrinogen-3 oxidase
MIGLGVSSISDSWYSLQNVKTWKIIINIRMEQITGFRGHLLTDEDLIIRKHSEFNVPFETSWKNKGDYFNEIPDV